jgi:hypothetical protein
MPDPKLKTAADEIKAIMRRHDIAGIVMLASPTHLEYLLTIDPSWSCCWMEEHAEGKLLRIKAKRADYPDLETQKKVLAESIGMLMGFIDCCNNTTRNLENVVGRISESIGITHSSRFEPPPEGNP